MSKGKRIQKKDKESEKQLIIFLNRFNEEFDKLGTNAKVFALITGISQSAISQYRNRSIKSIPTNKTIEKLVRHLGVSSNYLLGKSDTPSYEHEDIMKKIGLSKKAYQILQSIKGTELMNTINYLIEQEEINLLGGFSPIYDEKGDYAEAVERAIQSYDKEFERIETNCIPILSIIHNYYFTETTDEEMYIVNGDLKKLSDFKHRIDRFLANGKISTTNIIEDTFLKEIENSLRKSKEYKQNKLLQKQQDKQRKKTKKYNNIEKGAEK